MEHREVNWKYINLKDFEKHDVVSRCLAIAARKERNIENYSHFDAGPFMVVKSTSKTCQSHAMVDVGLCEFISASHWHWQVAESCWNIEFFRSFTGFNPQLWNSFCDAVVCRKLMNNCRYIFARTFVVKFLDVL